MVKYMVSDLKKKPLKKKPVKKKALKKKSRTTDYPSNKSAQRKYDAFCRAYHLNGNKGAAAAVVAGYSEKNARQQASKLLSIPYIQEKLAELQAIVLEEYTITVEQRLKWLETCVNRCLQGEPVMVYDYSAKEMIETGEWKFEGRTVVAAVSELNKMLGTTAGSEEGSLANALNNLASRLPN